MLIFLILTKLKNLLQKNLQRSHTEEILREMAIIERKLAATEIAAGPGVSRVNLSALADE